MKVRVVVASLVLVSLFAAAALAQAAPEARVDAVFSAFNANTPGCALGVVRDGKIVYEKGYGQASLELGVPISPQTVFDIGSTSKQITATSILLLAQQGRLALDDDIRKYVPELQDYGKKVTLRQMLHHTSGLRDYIGLLSLAGAQDEAVTGDDEALAILARQRGLNYPPGDDYLYSNSNFFLMSVVVKRVSGKTLREFAQENIFTPLGMKDTQILDDHTKVIPRKAASYAPKRGGGFQVETSNWEQTGDGAVQTTVEDLAKWDQNFYDPKVGGEALVRELQTPGTLNNGSKNDYALGLFLGEYRGLKRVSHGGSWAGFRAELARFPEQHFSAIVLCNVANGDPSGLSLKVAEVYLRDKMQPPSARQNTVAPAGEAEKFAGTYYAPETMSVRRFTARDGKLIMGANAELVPIGNGEFTLGATKINFAADGSSGTVAPSTGLPEKLVRVPPLTLDAAALNKFAGTSHSDELTVTWRLAVRDGKLMLVRPDSALNLKDDQQELRPLLPNIFAAGNMVLRFEPDASKFVIGLGRMRGMGFARQNAAGK
jgi:CubicO group peptidase (beta-lactamase class C family)